MKNLERWLKQTESLFSPEIYIKAAWYFLVGAALQRRVWYGAYQQLFPNLYVALVGPAAIGKGLVLGEVRKYLSHHKKLVEVTKGVVMPKEVITLGPNDTTYQAYLKCLQGASTSAGEYVYTSVAFVLEEMETLFSRADWTDKLLKMMLQIYDCKDYDYETAQSGCYKITNPCSSLIGGITPKSLVGLFKKNIMTDGFASRTIMVLENFPRKSSFFLDNGTGADFDKELKDWILHLTKLKGAVTINSETRKFVEDWWEKEGKKEKNPKLEGFYGRKRAHVLKLAMAAHFSDNLDMELRQEDFGEAIDFMNEVERRMLDNIETFQMNDFALVADEILKYVYSLNREVTLSEVARSFPMRIIELKDILDQLVVSGRLRLVKAGVYARQT